MKAMPEHELDQWVAALRHQGYTARDCASAAAACQGLAAGLMSWGQPHAVVLLSDVVAAVSAAHDNYHRAQAVLEA